MFWSRTTVGEDCKGKVGKEESSDIMSMFDDAMDETLNLAKFIKTFALMFFFGNLLTFASFALLPVFLLTLPQLISLLFNSGVLLILCSYALIKGGLFKYFIVHLLCKGSFINRFIALCLYSAMALNIYSALIKFDMMASLFSIFLEYVSLLYFLCSSFPGGTAGLNLLCGLIKRTICPF